MKDKMTPTPWLVTANENWIYSGAGKDLVPNGGDIICLEPDMEDSRLRFPANAQAIVSAVNGTYGLGINPEAVPELLRTLKNLCEYFEWAIGDPNFPAYREAKEAINKAKL